MTTFSVARSELILGGQKSGKSRRAELLAQSWLAQSPEHKAVLIATAQPGDDEMRERIRRHRQDRADRVPGMVTVERSKRDLLVTCGMAAVIMSSPPWAIDAMRPPASGLRVVFLDVGQGDATVLILPGGGWTVRRPGYRGSWASGYGHC